MTINTALSIEKYEQFKDILLTPERVYRYHRWVLTQEKKGLDYITKKGSLKNSIYMSLQPEFKRRVQLVHIFPFRSYPLIVIFDEQNKRFSLSDKKELKANMFDNSVVIYLLDIQDYAVVDTIIKGSVRMEMRLLQKMGFKVVAIPWHLLTCFNTSKARRNKVIDEITNVWPDFVVGT